MTAEGDAEDYWLEPGEVLLLASGERAHIGGWREAVRCEVEPPVQPRERRFARLHAWLRSRPRRRAPEERVA